MTAPRLTLRAKIQPGQCDELGHLAVREYAQTFSTASWGFYDLMGFGAQAMRERGVGFADLKHVMMFLNEIHRDEEIAIYSGVTSIGNKSVHMKHLLINSASRPCASLEVVTVQFDLATRASIPVTADIRELFALHVADDWDVTFVEN